MKRTAHWLWLPVLLCCAALLSVSGRAYPLPIWEEPEPSETLVRTYGAFTAELGRGAAVAYDRGVLTVRGGDVALSGGGDGYRVVLSGDCQLTLLGVETVGRGGPGLTVEPGCDPVLLLPPGYENSFTGDDNYAGIQVSYSDEDLPSLSIDGDGTLVANGGRNSAGIGGSFYGGVYYGDIFINGGQIVANGGSNAAGIGSAVNSLGVRAEFKMEDRDWGVITISGGSVTARGDGSGAGIGGGNHADSGRIVISGGAVTAAGASGIGSGVGSSSADKKQEKGPGYYAADVKITGGEITALGRSNGAGIGGAMYCDAAVVITGGTVYAAGDGGSLFQHGGAGIGGGFEGHGEVRITGGAVTALGGGGGAGIGSGGAANANTERGSDCRGGTPTLEATRVEITGGRVEADGGERGGAAIGGGLGADRAEVSISGGTVTARGGAGTRHNPRGGAAVGSGYSGLADAAAPIARYFTMTDTTVAVTGGAVTAVGGWGAAAIGGGADNAMAESVSITGGSVTAFSDGIRFALDTRRDREDGSVVSRSRGREVHGVIQGTMADLYTDHGRRDYEGLTLTLESKDGVLELTLPEGYRSFARTVPTPEDGVLWRIRSGDEVFAPGAEERSIPDRLKSGTLFDLSENGFQDLFFLVPARTVRVSVSWDDGNDVEENRPDASLRLLAGETILRSARIAADAAGEDLTVSWDDVPRYTADGTLEVIYSLWVVPMPGYSVAVNREDGDFTVECSRAPEFTEIAGALHWIGGEADPAPPRGVSLVLLTGGREYRRTQVLPGEDGQWAFAFTDLPRTLGGRDPAWTLAPEGAENYEVRLEGYEIYLTYTVPPPEDEA